jgi:hypothetical protein
MTARLRRATAKDVEAMIAVKEALALDPDRPSRRGGFLLGCPRERYLALIETSEVLLVEAQGEIGGFAVALPDPVLRTSDLWQRRGRISWTGRNAEPPADERTAYFDQLAIRPGWPRLHGLVLALAAARRLAESGHVHLYATILHEPVRNEAALPLLRGVGGQPVGLVEELYEGVGRVVSELHHARLKEGLAGIASIPAGARLLASVERMPVRWRGRRSR